MKVLVADDHALVRAGIAPFLARLSREVAIVEAWDAPTLWATLTHHPDLDLALVDLHMPGMQATRSIAELREAFPSLPIVVLSAVEDRAAIEAALRAGAAGYIPKSSNAEVMVGALRLVIAGGQYLPPTMLEQGSRSLAYGAAQEPAAPRPVRRLSQRQSDVVGLLAQGCSNKMIAKRLGLTEGTIKSHMVQIFHALGVRNRTAAVIAAQRLGATADESGS